MKPKNKRQIQSNAGTETETVIAAFATGLNASEDRIREIQWMPPGISEITPHVNGKAKTIKVTADEAGARKVDQDLREMLAKAETGLDVRPYIDFNHDDREAAGWPLSARWAGADPKTGGIRVKLELSEAGFQAVKGKQFQAFSPELLISKDGKIAGVGLNMGGLVNRPAFKSIERLYARRAGETELSGGGPDGNGSKPATAAPDDGAKGSMKHLMKLLASLALVSSSELDETAAVAEISAKSGEIKDAISVKAKLATDYVPKADHVQLVASYEKLRKENAERVVAKAVAEGRLAPKNDEVKAKWVARIESNPEDADLLETLEAKNVPVQVIKIQKPESSSIEAGAESALVMKAKEIAKNKKISDEDALQEAADEFPDLYEDYTNKLGKVTA